MKDLKKILKEKPAYADVFVMSKEGPVKLKKLTSLATIKKQLSTEEAMILAQKYYEDLALHYPQHRIVSLGIPVLELSYEDALDHIRRNTDVGKFLVAQYQEFLEFVWKRISGELSW